MVVLNGSARFGPGEVVRLMPALLRWAETVRGRDGCLRYCLSIDAEDPDVMHVTELWRDQAAVEAHIVDLNVLMDGLEGAKMPWLELVEYVVASERLLIGEGVRDAG